MDLNTEVSTLITDLVDAQKSFTAFDVTTELRAMFPNEKIYHYEVKPIVHGLMIAEDEYSGEQDFILHSNGPILYKPNITPYPPRPATSTNTTLQISHTTVSPDKRGRICIPKSFVDGIVHITDRHVNMGISDGNEIIVNMSLGTPSQSFNCKDVRSYKIDKDGNVRISTCMVNRIGKYVEYTIDKIGATLFISGSN